MMMKMWSIFPDAVAGAELEGGEAGAADVDVALDGGGGEKLLPSTLPRSEPSDGVEAEGALGAAGAVALGADAGGEAELEPPDDVRPKIAAMAASSPPPLKSVLVRIEPSPYRFPARDGNARRRPKLYEGSDERVSVCGGRLSSASGRALRARAGARALSARVRARPRPWRLSMVDSNCMAAAATKKKLTILVVEDDEDVRDIVCDILEEEGYRAVAAADGHEAMERLRAGTKPCVILLDLTMPRVDGWTFRDWQRKTPDYADIPVVVLSATRDISKEAKQLAAAGYIEKPVAIDALLKVVEAHC
jgi:CheY-like chemotaxis protein